MKKEKIKDIAKVGSGQSAPQDYSDFSTEGTPFVRAGSLKKLLLGADEYSLEKVQNHIAKKYKLKLYPPGTVIFAKSGMSATKNRIYKLKNHCHVVNHLATLLPYKNIYPDYLVISLRRNPPSLLIKDPSYPSINQPSIEKLKIPVPENYEDQIRIATLLSRAEALIARRKESIRLLDVLLKSTFLEMFGDPVRNEKGWKKEPLNKLGTLDRGVSKHRPRNAPELLGGPYPLIQTGDVANAGLYIKAYSQTYSDIGLQQSKLWPKGTLCITIAANIAKTSILDFDACFPDSVVGFTSLPEESYPIYVHFLFKYFQRILEKNAPQAAQKNINLEILRNLPVPKPSKQEQTPFVLLVERVEPLKTKYEASLQELENLYGSLTQRTFRGDLDLSRIPVEVGDVEKAEIQQEKAAEQPPYEPTAVIKSIDIDAELQQLANELQRVIKEKFQKPFSFTELWAELKISLDSATPESEDAAPDTESKQYEKVKTIVFDLLKEEQPFLTQLFDDDRKEVVLKLNA